MPNDISLKKEIQRKLIHFGSGIIPILVIFYGRESILPILSVLTILFVLIDFFKSKIIWIKILYLYFFKTIVRENEFENLTGASWVLLGNLFVLLLFPENIAIFSMFILCISDSLAAIIGKYSGNTKIFNKSLQGSISFIISGLFVSTFFPNIALSIRVFAIISATGIELFPSQINDNISIPITIALCCTIGGLFI
jgi:dolichol kinase